MNNIKKFNTHHLKGFKSRDELDVELCLIENHMNPNVDVVSVVNHEGEVICFAGVNHLRVGVGEVWIIGSELIDSNKLLFYRSIRGLIKFCHEYLSLHRLELAIDMEWEEGYKWAESIGFQFESIARQYGATKKDHAIYTRFQ